MTKAGQVAASILDEIAPLVYPGSSTGKIDDFIRDRIEELGVTSATIGYKGYQHASCISVNHVVCHGIPSDGKTLKNGDIINIDVTVIKDGYHGDTSKMFHVGTPKPALERLVNITQECLYKAIDIVKPGITTGDIGFNNLNILIQ